MTKLPSIHISQGGMLKVEENVPQLTMFPLYLSPKKKAPQRKEGVTDNRSKRLWKVQDKFKHYK